MKLRVCISTDTAQFGCSFAFFSPRFVVPIGTLLVGTAWLSRETLRLWLGSSRPRTHYDFQRAEVYLHVCIAICRWYVRRSCRRSARSLYRLPWTQRCLQIHTYQWAALPRIRCKLTHVSFQYRFWLMWSFVLGRTISAFLHRHVSCRHVSCLASTCNRDDFLRHSQLLCKCD